MQMWQDWYEDLEELPNEIEEDNGSKEALNLLMSRQYSDWALEYMSKAIQRGIIKGDNQPKP
jgi:hypothetical protein